MNRAFAQTRRDADTIEAERTLDSEQRRRMVTQFHQHLGLIEPGSRSLRRLRKHAVEQRPGHFGFLCDQGESSRYCERRAIVGRVFQNRSGKTRSLWVVATGQGFECLSGRKIAIQGLALSLFDVPT